MQCSPAAPISHRSAAEQRPRAGQLQPIAQNPLPQNRCSRECTSSPTARRSRGRENKFLESGFFLIKRFGLISHRHTCPSRRSCPVKPGYDLNNIDALRFFGRGKLQGALKGGARVFRIGFVDHEDHSAKWLGVIFRVSKKHDRTGGFAHELSSHIAEKGMENDLFFQRTGHDHIDAVLAQRAEDAFGRVAFLIMNGQVCRELEFLQDATNLAFVSSLCGPT